MILLITPSGRAQECSKALVEAISQPVQVAENLRQAILKLRAEEYLAVVIDQSLLETEPGESETVLQHIGTAIPVHVNFAISGIERVIRELRAALHRRKREQVVARQAAEQVLWSELKDPLTAILLSCELALKVPDLSEAAAEKIRIIDQLAQELRTRLGCERPHSGTALHQPSGA
jgi:signal transduction histidine kinase